MIDSTKVRRMARLEAYEKGKGKKELKMHRYTMRGYLSLRLMESFFAGTFAYVMGAGLYMLRYYSNIMTEGLAFSYGGIFRNMLIVYAVLMTAYLIITYRIETKRYLEMRKSVKQYDRELLALKKYLDKEEELQ